MKYLNLEKLNEVSRIKFKRLTESKDFVILKLKSDPEYFVRINAEDIQLLFDEFNLVLSGSDSDVFIFMKR